MSLAMQEARYRTQGAGPAGAYQGGFWGSVFGGIKKIGGAVLGATPVGRAYKFGRDLMGRGGGGSTDVLGPYRGKDTQGRDLRLVQSPRMPIMPGGIIPLTGAVRTAMPGTSAAEMAIMNGDAGVACPKGYHSNKSDYYTQEGFVPKGSRCVKDRRRNSLNPAALTRAVGRVKSAKTANKILGRITIRSACKTK